MTKTIKTIWRLDQLCSSPTGIRRYRVIFTDGESRRTEDGAPAAYTIASAYGVIKPEFRNVPVEFTLTRDGRISRARPLGRSE